MYISWRRELAIREAQENAAIMDSITVTPTDKFDLYYSDNFVTLAVPSEFKFAHVRLDKREAYIVVEKK